MTTALRRPSGSLAGWVAVIGGTVLVCLFGDGSLLNLATLIAIWSLWGVSMNLIWGAAGQFSMAQIGLGGLSAYTTVILVSKEGWGVWPAMLAGVAAAVVASLIVAGASMRLAGFQFAIMTLAFALVFTSVLETSSLAGRTTGIGAPLVFGTVHVGPITWDLSSREGGFLIFLACLLVIALLAVGQVMRSRTGRALLALREDQTLAASLGIRPSSYRLIAFVASAVLAGVAGVMYAEYLRFITPGFFGLDQLISLIVIVVLGGRGFRFGPVLGAAVYYTLTIQVGLSTTAFGVALIVLVLLAPGGIMGTVQRAYAREAARLRRRRRVDTPGPGAAAPLTTEP